MIPGGLLDRIREAPEDAILLCSRIRIGRALEGRRWWEQDTLEGQDETCALLDGFRRAHLVSSGNNQRIWMRPNL